MTIKALTCPNCGGAINRDRMICEYCGTKFHIEENNELGIVRIESYTSPTKRFTVAAHIPNEVVAIDADMVIDRAKAEIARKLADDLIRGEAIEFICEEDWKQCQQIITARLRVLMPQYRF